MFSSSLFTAETPAPSQIKAGSTPASTESPVEGEQTVNEPAGAFAKELQSVVNEEQNGKQSQQVEPEVVSTQATVSMSSETDEEGAANLLMENTETDAENNLGKVESNLGKVEEQPDGQISVRGKSEPVAGGDPAAKQQIMSDGEELLSRLSESSKQLAAPVDQPVIAAEDVPEGKKLPPEHITRDSNALVAALPAAEQATAVAEPLAAEVQQVPEVHVAFEQAVSETSGDGAAATETAAIVQPTLTADETITTDETIAANAQATGISPQELARVFATPDAQPPGVEGQIPLAQGKPGDVAVTAQDMATEDIEADATVMAQASVVEGSPLIAKTNSEGQGERSVSGQPGELLQKSASPNITEQAKAQRLPADLVNADLASTERPEGQVKADSRLTPAALATATAVHHSNQPLATETASAWVAAVGNPSLSSYAGGAVAMPEMQAVASGDAGAQLDAAEGIAVGSAAMAAAMEQSVADSSSEAKSAEPVHSLSSGLATQQGQGLAQARSEAAAVQSPLQLSKEQAGDQLAERMQMMMSKNLKHVDIRLDPPELGKLQIKLSLNQDQASVQFTVANQQTRDLVEQAMPRLRELLSQQGLQLAQSSVQQDSPRQQFAGQPNQQHQGQQGGSGGQHNSGSSHGQDSGGINAEAVDMYVSQPTDRVDYYA